MAGATRDGRDVGGAPRGIPFEAYLVGASVFLVIAATNIMTRSCPTRPGRGQERD